MSRRTRWILLALIVVIVGGAIALVVVERPKLDDARSAVDRHWKPLRAPDQLVLRYQKLEGALSAFDAAGGSDRGVSKDLHAALAAWKQALKRRRRRQSGERRERGRGAGHPADRERARVRAAEGRHGQHRRADHVRHHQAERRPRDRLQPGGPCLRERTHRHPRNSPSPGCSASTPVRSSCSAPASDRASRRTRPQGSGLTDPGATSLSPSGRTGWAATAAAGSRA